MATLTLSLLSIDKDASNVSLKLTSDGALPATGTLKWRYWTDTLPVDKVLTEADIAALTGVGLVLTPQSVGISTSEDAKFQDGVHHIIFDDADDADLKILVNKGAERCITSGIGKLAEKDCGCDGDEALYCKLISWRFAADVQFDCKDYDGAHNLIVSINKLCAGDCGCTK